jgi:hypothetical protein
MADAHHDAHHDSHDSHDDAHDAHDEHEHDVADPDESTIRTPLWLPFVGLGFLATLAVTVFLMMAPSGPSGTATDGDAGGAPSAAAPEGAR